MELELVKNNRLILPKEAEYLWRYFDIHKFLNFLNNQKLRFSRMDQFEDPLEGIPLSALTVYAEKLDLNLIQNMSLSELILNRNLFNNVPEALRKKLISISEIQKSTFAICFFYEQRESMAMWNLYSNADGVSIKIPFVNLKKQLQPEISRMKISSFYGGRVDYQDFKRVNPYAENSKSKVPKVALRKDSSFSHEKEFRFVLRGNSIGEELKGVDSLRMDLKNLNMKIVCHPRMNPWKKSNILQLLKDHGLESTFEESEIKLRN